MLWSLKECLHFVAPFNRNKRENRKIQSIFCLLTLSTVTHLAVHEYSIPLYTKQRRLRFYLHVALWEIYYGGRILEFDSGIYENCMGNRKKYNNINACLIHTRSYTPYKMVIVVLYSNNKVNVYFKILLSNYSYD